MTTAVGRGGVFLAACVLVFVGSCVHQSPPPLPRRSPLPAVEQLDTFPIPIEPVSTQARAERPSTFFRNADTLRQALLLAGIADGDAADDRPDLDRTLDSSRFGTATDSFVAAYYFSDELERGAFLGPLHLSRFNRSSHRWQHATGLDEDARGAVLGVTLEDRYLAVQLHWNPSAGVTLVLETATLSTVAQLKGFTLRFLPDGSILFFSNQLHFAPTHQARLLVFDPSTRKESELFPGEEDGSIARAYRQSISAAYARLAEAEKQIYETSAYGAIDDFDRDIDHIQIATNGARMAFAVTYGADRFPIGIQHPSMISVVSCDRHMVLSWTCSERLAAQVADEAGLALNEPLVPTETDTLVEAVLHGR